MTYSIKNLVGVAAWRRGDSSERKGFFGTRKPLCGDWGKWGNKIYDFVVGCHLAHGLDFSAALLCFFMLYGDGSIMEEAETWQVRWISRIVLYNLCCEVVVYSIWHFLTYSDSTNMRSLTPAKMNKTNQYEPDGLPVRMFSSSSGHLEREITFTTLGWLQSSFWQCLLTHAWACGYLRCYLDFWGSPLYSVALLASVTYWREIHFYWAHRGMHPWWDRENGLFNGDVGAFLYRHAHSLHHKSYNPGPWSGLSMHPLEHLLYYSCATIPPLFLCVHPLHFLYTKFHCDIAPIGGHDGYEEPGGNGDFHYLHHAKFECNYGVPFPIDFDKMFGTWVEYKDFKKTGKVEASEWSLRQMHDPAGTDLSVPLLALSWDAVKEHTREDDCWIVLYGRVVDVTGFLSTHPGGKHVLLAVAGKDATAHFEEIHESSGGFSLVSKHLPQGTVGNVAGWSGPPPPGPTQRKMCSPLWLLIPVLVAAVVGCVVPVPL